ncbi:MAG TPA: hypothetical protein VH394_11140 [Thermoanaerobaculia bacterium]|nr:hypothetical protein [Thermoanaerobaculia bacterium]
MPKDPTAWQQVLEFGIREWRIQQALEAYRRGEGSLAYAASRAGLSVREIIPLAYAHGLEPKVDEGLASSTLTGEQASNL